MLKNRGYYKQTNYYMVSLKKLKSKAHTERNILDVATDRYCHPVDVNCRGEGYPNSGRYGKNYL